jgi:hypothetical protein
MNNEYLMRRAIAENVAKTVASMGVDIVIVGSVAYGPDAVTTESDVDLVGICSFRTTDFEKLFSEFGLHADSNAVRYANDGSITNLSIIFRVEGIEVGLHLWDRSAFDGVTQFLGGVKTFRSDLPDEAGKPLQARADTQTFRSLRGTEKVVGKNPKQVEGGTILDFFAFDEDVTEFYPNIQLYNLLLDPVALTDKAYIADGIATMNRLLKEKLIAVYGADHSSEVSLCNALPDKIKKKIPPSLRERLDTYF